MMLNILVILYAIGLGVCIWYLASFFENIKTIADYYKTLTRKNEHDGRYFRIDGKANKIHDDIMDVGQEELEAKSGISGIYGEIKPPTEIEKKCDYCGSPMEPVCSSAVCPRSPFSGY